MANGPAQQRRMITTSKIRIIGSTSPCMMHVRRGTCKRSCLRAWCVRGGACCADTLLRICPALRSIAQRTAPTLRGPCGVLRRFDVCGGSLSGCLDAFRKEAGRLNPRTCKTTPSVVELQLSRRIYAKNTQKFVVSYANASARLGTVFRECVNCSSKPQGSGRLYRSGWL